MVKLKKRWYDEEEDDGMWWCVGGGGGFSAVPERGAYETLLQGTDGRVEGHREGDGGGYCDV